MKASAAKSDGDWNAAQTDPAARADQEFEDALTTLAAEISELRRSFVSLIDQLGRVGEAGTHGVRAALQAVPREGLGVGEKVSAELGGEFKELREELVRTAQKHPWRTVTLAAAMGLIVGLATRR